MTYPSYAAFKRWWDAYVAHHEDGMSGKRLGDATKALKAEAAAPPVPTVPTVRVRIAVPISANECWLSIGESELGVPGEAEALKRLRDNYFVDDHPVHVVMLTADLPLPQVAEVEGEVE